MTIRTNLGAGSMWRSAAGATAAAIVLTSLPLSVLAASPSAAGVRHRSSVSAARNKRDDKSFHYKGTIGVGHRIVATINLNCRDKYRSHGYVARRPGDPESIFNRPDVQSNLTGGKSGGVTNWAPTASVQWPHPTPGSRLATAIRVTVQANQTRTPVDYDVTIWCGPQAGAGGRHSGAWIIVG